MRFFAATDVGKRRSGNEDFLFASDLKVGVLPNLFVVADGMGGHNAGEVASELAVTTIVRSLRESVKGDVLSALREAIDAANLSILTHSINEPDKSGMGTTVVAVSVLEDHILGACVGDSRLYVFDPGGFRQVSRDHTVVGEMLRMGSISKTLAANHPKRHMLTRCLGVSEHVEADFFNIPRKNNEQILLATDGLTNMLTDIEISTVLERDLPPREKVDVLLESANINGGDDNITAILLDLKR